MFSTPPRSPRGITAAFDSSRKQSSLLASPAHYVSTKKPLKGLFWKHMCAGEKNRTPDYCLEGSRFTTKLHPRFEYTKRLVYVARECWGCHRMKRGARSNFYSVTPPKQALPVYVTKQFGRMRVCIVRYTRDSLTLKIALKVTRF